LNDTPELRASWVWPVPLVALALLAVTIATDGNLAAFRVINAWSLRTGPDMWPYVTILGDTAVALALLAPLVLRRPDIAWALAIGAILTTLFVHAGKPLVSAPRPPGVLVPPDLVVIGPGYTAHSFPSGHTATIFVAAGLVASYCRSVLVRTLLVALAVTVGLSRVVVGVHWPVDVLAGAAGGWLCAMLGIRLALRWPGGRHRWAHGVWTVIAMGCAVALLAGLKTGYPQAAPLQYAAGGVSLALCALVATRLVRHRDSKDLS
jgi:membrane-associated phospholipid phosphatase